MPSTFASEDLMVNLLKKRKKDVVQSREGDDRVKLTTGIVSFMMLLVMGAMVFKFSGNMSIIDALYLTVVSSSTVGYGDYYPSTNATRLFAIFFLPLSTLLLGKVITDYTEMRVARTTEVRQRRILLATITMQDYNAMDSDGDGRVSLLEFMCRTLVAQEKVTQEDIDEVTDRFKQLDKNGNGFIEVTEI
eukprot:jgi/Undpi1/4796/HiC_scaffold_19.g08149.m1